MRNRRIYLSALALLGLPAAAHHSPAIYDLSHEQTITGTVVDFEWVAPHTWVTVNAADDAGAVTTWSLEGMNPSYLGRRGWNRSTLNPGDRIEVTFYPRKDGTLAGMFLRGKLADGTVKVMAISPEVNTQ